MTEPSHWQGLALAIGPDRVVLGPEAARLVLGLLSGAERVARRDGIGLSPPLRSLREALMTVAAAGHLDVQISSIRAQSTLVDPINLAEASQLVGRSRRQTHRLATSGAFGHAGKVGREIVVSRAEVIAYRRMVESTREG